MIRSVAQVLSVDLLTKGILGFASLLLIRILSQEEYATYTFALSIAVVGTETFIGTMRTAYVVGYERLEIREANGPFLGLQLSMAVLIGVALVALMGPTAFVSWAVAALVIARTVLEFVRTVFQYRRQFAWFSGLDLARVFLFAVGLTAAIWLFGSGLRAWVPLGLDAGAITLVLVVTWSRLGTLTGLGSWRDTVQLITTIFRGQYKYLVGYYALLAMVTQVDVLAVKALATETQLAAFGSALRYYAVLSLALGAVHVVLLPLLGGAATHAEVRSMFARHRAMAVAFGAATLVCVVLAGWFIPIVDGGKYPEAVIMFRVLAVSSVVSFAFSPHVNLLLGREDFRFLFRLVGVVLLVHVGMCVVLIPGLGGLGAAGATTLAFGLLNSAIYWRSRDLQRRAERVGTLDSWPNGTLEKTRRHAVGYPADR